MYHSVGPAPAPLFEGDPTPNHSWPAFTSYLEWLTGEVGVRIVPLSELAGAGPNRFGGRPAAALTFDDGCRDNFETVVPYLIRRGWPATFFVPLNAVGHPSGVDAATLRRTAGEGLFIGGHGVTHRRLTRLTDEEVRTELNEPRRVLADITGRACEELAYPYGDADARVRAEARRAGYRLAVTAGAEAACDGFEAPRDLPPARASRVAFAMSWLGLLPKLRRWRVAVTERRPVPACVASGMSGGQRFDPVLP